MTKLKAPKPMKQNCFLRMTSEHKTFVEAEAQRLGLSINAYMNLLVASEIKKQKVK